MQKRLLAPFTFAILPIGFFAGTMMLAQEKKTEAKGHERLMPYWTKLDLTDAQRDKYDKVMRDYRPKVQKLEEELDKLKEERWGKLMDLLTSAQRKKLDSLRGTKDSDKKGGKGKDDEDDHKDVKVKSKKIEEKETSKGKDEPGEKEVKKAKPKVKATPKKDE